VHWIEGGKLDGWGTLKGWSALDGKGGGGVKIGCIGCFR
jgi:hypothetical protein